jgi:hypothetical protein
MRVAWWCTAVACLAAGMVSSAWAIIRSPGMDFWTAYVVARKAGDDLYSRQAREEMYLKGSSEAVLEWNGVASPPRSVVAAASVVQMSELELGYRAIDSTGSPLFYAAMAPLAPLRYDAAYLVFAALSLAAFLGSVLVLCRLAGASWPTSLLVAGIVAIAFEPHRSQLRVANVNHVQLALVAAFLWLATRRARAADVGAGALFGLAVLFKPNLAFLAVGFVAWVGARAWGRLARAGAGVAAGLAVGLLLPMARFGAGCWAAWRESLPLTFAANRAVEFGNYGLARLLAETTGRELSSALALLLFAAAALVAWRTRDVFLSVGLAAAALLLSAPLVWVHYVVLALPLLLAIAVRGRGIVVAAVCLFLLSPLLLGSPPPLSPIAQNAALLLAFGWSAFDRLTAPRSGPDGAPGRWNLVG